MLGINCIWNHFITPIIATSSSLCWCFVYWCKAQHVLGTGSDFAVDGVCDLRTDLANVNWLTVIVCCQCAELVEIALKIIFCSIMQSSGTHTSFYMQNFLSRKLFTCLEIKKCTILPARECGCNISVGFPALFVVRNLTRFSQKHSLFLESTSALCVPPSQFLMKYFNNMQIARKTA